MQPLTYVLIAIFIMIVIIFVLKGRKKMGGFKTTKDSALKGEIKALADEINSMA